FSLYWSSIKSAINYLCAISLSSLFSLFFISQAYIQMSEPSKVIHVRNVGQEIAENDLLQLVQPFGVVTKLVMLRAKNQALLQMHDVASAVNALQYYANVQPSIRGRNVYIQFSSHQELTTMEQNPSGRNGGDQVGS
ncbi:hypothetical protein GIB67_003755, partial [Kingdonia uniflora]